ncbi:GspH/FimT family pseudopilin [Acinetobacter sp. WCHAc060025]|uniref:GspH/FimT family pseudopilin n=1 Tax=Acinetobacter sp. WCHAc060025 TaxID=2518625 RepID=UPI001023E687|nr:GspH/FimT family pseudopilin [Acinetobacter sp. WCHAc060025]RZG77575.1 prepilin-type N-terminal cleavage/methylation domain-containing protein [Acinetobacter sp. WCHAc060025]
MYSYCKEQAFTLVELIVTISVLAILATLAIPSYINFKAKQELNHISALIQLLNQTAKSNAVTYHSIIVICSSTNATQCANDQWNTGIIMFSDLNSNQQVDPDERIHSVVDTKLKYGSLTWDGGVTSTKVLTFQGDTGLPRSSFGSFYYCSQHASSLHRRFALPKTGLLRVESYAC